MFPKHEGNTSIVVMRDDAAPSGSMAGSRMEGSYRNMTLATQHKWLAAVLRGHYGYYGRPHNYPALNGFYQQARRIWFRCLRRRSQKSRRMGWLEFEILTARFALPVPRITRTWAQARR